VQCVVLAGGLGTRMGEWTARMPKALVPVGGQPFAEWQVEWLASQGVGEVVYSIGYRGDMLRDSLGDGSRWGVRIRYVDEGDHLLGTAGALRLATDLGVLDRSFLVLYGDSYLPIDLGDVWWTFEASGRPALMTVFRNESQWDHSNAWYADGQVVRYDKRNPTAEMTYIDYGLSVLSRVVLEERVPAATVFDLADVFHVLSVEGQLAGYEATHRFYEIGSPAGLRQLQEYLGSTPRRV
jgi:NDP-sugar pyrophosphorylase family protein